MLKTRTTMARSALAVVAALAFSTNSALAEGDHIVIKRNTWSFGAMFGQYDKNQLQRGFQVYRDVCSSCHGLNRIAFRNLAQPGGPEFPEAAVKALAKEYEVKQPPNDDGEVVLGPAKLSDYFPPLYENENAARATHNGALPPDLSLIAKARSVAYSGSWYAHPYSMVKDILSSYQEGGADYLVALLSGYSTPTAYVRDDKGHLKPAGDKTGDGVVQCISVVHGEHGKPDVCNKLAEGMNYNKSFVGHQIAMANPFDGHEPDSPRVIYQDGTKPTIENYAKDVAAFLSWASDPSLNGRKQTGWLVLVYLLITSVLLYVAKRRIWSGVKH